jgi:hypothetical protein
MNKIQTYLLLTGVSMAASAAAVETDATKTATDITKECCNYAGGLVGPGSVVFNLKGGPQVSLGIYNRLIPTYEDDWDFGFAKGAGAGIGSDGAGGPGAGREFYATHFAETGVVGGDYYRNQFNVFLNVLPDDKSWSFHAQLQYDQPLDVTNLDNGGGAGVQQSDFGVERLNVSTKVPWSDNQRIHAGFDYWEADTIEGPGLLFGDDSAGVWITGKPRSNIFYNVGYHFLEDANIGNNNVTFSRASANNDRDAAMGFVDWKATANHKIRFMYAYDKSQNTRVVEQNNVFLGIDDTDGDGAADAGTIEGGRSDFTAHNIGAYWIGKFGKTEAFLEAVYKTGDVKNAGLDGVVIDSEGNTGRDHYDIESYAFAAYVKRPVTQKLTMRVDGIYTSGDSSASDGKLGGYSAVMSDQRFSSWGGENTLLGDGNWLLGLPVFSHLPEGLGNGTPVNIGGISNFRNTGAAGRGDNPGYYEFSLGSSYAYRPNIIFNSRGRAFGWNEEFVVNNVITGSGFGRNEVSGGYAGTEFTNEVAVGLNKNTIVKFQASYLFPGKGIEELTEANGFETDENASRIAAELILGL